MGSKSFKLDMSMMYFVHDAFRRELERLARVTAKGGDEPRIILSTAAGWEMFKRYLRVHHTSEDDTVWGVLETTLADRPSESALLAAMEEEHAAIDPLLASIDEALADRDGGPSRLGGLIDTLATKLGGHLTHEEADGLELIDAFLTEEQWMTFAAVHRDRIGNSEIPRYLPWMLDEATDERKAEVLSKVPEAARLAYHDEWRKAYEALDIWPGLDLKDRA